MAKDVTETQMGDTVEQLNEDKVIRLIPMFIYLLLISLIGIPGNGLVCYIYKTKYRMSGSRWFVFFLALTDIVLCVINIPLEFAISLYQYNFTNVVLCKSYMFLNAWSMQTLGFTFLSISIDRYRKVCQPLRWQIDLKKARILSTVAVSAGCAISLPLIWIYGIYDSKLEKYKVYVSECSFKSSSRDPSFAFYYLMFGMVLFTSELITICTMYCFIRKEIILHLYEKNVHKQVGPTLTTAQSDGTSTSCLQNVATDSAKENASKQLKTDIESEMKATCEMKSSAPNTDDSLSDDADEQTTTTVIDGETNEFEMTSLPNKPPGLKRTKSKRRTRTRKATFSMFLISLTFVLSYLPVLLLLLLRSVDEEFEPRLTDAGRATYKFFLRLYVLNCSVNPFIYGLSDSRFRGDCKDALNRIKVALKCKRNSYSVQ